MLNCWRVNESWTVDIAEFLIQKLSAALCDNSNFMNFKIDSFKIRREIREFYEILKFVKFEFWIYGSDRLLLVRKRICTQSVHVCSAVATGRCRVLLNIALREGEREGKRRGLFPLYPRLLGLSTTAHTWLSSRTRLFGCLRSRKSGVGIETAWCLSYCVRLDC